MKRILWTVCLAIIAFFYVQAASIPIHGSLLRPKRMSVGVSPASGQQPVTVPVAAQQNPTNVEVTFLSNLGSLTIQVVNAQGAPVYQQTVNAVAGGRLVIDTLNWPAGTYTILILDEWGGCLEGQFEK